MGGEGDYYAAAERRIEYLALGIGGVGSVLAAIIWGIHVGAGVAAGAACSWLNFRWMKQGVGALARLARAQQDAVKFRVPRRVYFKFIARYVLLLGGAYVILTYLKLPVWSLLAGFSAVVVAAAAEVISQLFRDNHITHADS
jgi:hypothetical protein